MEVDPVEEQNQPVNIPSSSLRKPHRNEKNTKPQRRRKTVDQTLSHRHKQAANKPPVNDSEEGIHQARTVALRERRRDKYVKLQEIRDKYVAEGHDPPQIKGPLKGGMKAFNIWLGRHKQEQKGTVKEKTETQPKALLPPPVQHQPPRLTIIELQELREQYVKNGSEPPEITSKDKTGRKAFERWVQVEKRKARTLREAVVGRLQSDLERKVCASSSVFNSLSVW